MCLHHRGRPYMRGGVRSNAHSYRNWGEELGNAPSYLAMSMMAATDRPIRSAAASISRSPRWA